MKKFDSTAPDMLKYHPKKEGFSMPQSEAQKAATTKYRKKFKKQFFFEINMKTRPHLFEYFSEMENKQAYIRHLIATDMKAKGLETDGLDGE